MKRRLKNREILIYLLSLVSLAILLVRILPVGSVPLSSRAAGSEAEKTMKASLGILTSYCRINNINIGNPEVDPSTTGLIGPPLSPISTTLGQLEAKRTTLNTAWAALITRLLIEEGVQRGDTIAIACSGSFPGFMVASLAAATALDLHAITILSIGSSSYGASNPDFTILDIYNILKENNIVNAQPAAVSLGGGNDRGLGFEGQAGDSLRAKIRDSAIPFIEEASLVANIRARDSIYFRGGQGSVKAFINSGGSYSSMGTSTLSLRIEPGRVGRLTLPPTEQMGEIFSMYSKGIPVIHLLNVDGLCRRYGIEWDPSPGNGKKRSANIWANSGGKIFLPASGLILFILSMLLYNRFNRQLRKQNIQ